MLLKDVISDVKGASAVSADYGKGEVTVQFEDQSILGQVKKLIEKEGYGVVE